MKIDRTDETEIRKVLLHSDVEYEDGALRWRTAGEAYELRFRDVHPRLIAYIVSEFVADGLAPEARERRALRRFIASALVDPTLFT